MHCLKYDLECSNLDQTHDMPFPLPSASEGFMTMGPGVLLQVGQRCRSSHSTLGRWRGRSDNSIEAFPGGRCLPVSVLWVLDASHLSNRIQTRVESEQTHPTIGVFRRQLGMHPCKWMFGYFVFIGNIKGLHPKCSYIAFLTHIFVQNQHLQWSFPHGTWQVACFESSGHSRDLDGKCPGCCESSRRSRATW